MRATSLSNRLQRYFGGLIAAVLVLLGLLWYYGAGWLNLIGARQQIVTSAADALENSASYQQALIRHVLKERRGDMMILAENRLVSRTLVNADAVVQPDMERIFDRLSRAHPDVYRKLMIVDPGSGRVRASSDAAEVGQQAADEDLISRAGEVGIVELLRASTTAVGKHELVIARQMLAPDADGYPAGRLVGLLLAYIPFTNLLVQDEVSTELQARKGRYTLLLNNSGQVMARSYSAGSIDESFLAELGAATEGFEGTLTLREGRPDEIVAVFRYVPLDLTEGWRLLHFQSSQAMLGHLMAQLNSLLMIGVVLSLLSLGLVGWMARRIAQPFDVLTNVAHELGRGNFAARVPELRTTSREFYAVADAFNGMAAAIADTHSELERRVAARTDELEQHRRHLEHLVAERTADLEQARKAAEASSVAKSQFLANMSHELRTPLNGILGMTEIACRRTRDPQLLDPLGKVKRASEHLLGVINDILDISKIEADRMELERISFTLGEVFENFDSLVRQRAEEKGLAFSIDLPVELALQSVKGDSLRIGQVLLNLVGNAVKFTPAGSVSVRVSSKNETGETLTVCVEVSDTGIGIAAEDQARLFSPFEQADGSMTRKYGGTGLGLAISKRLVALMDGELGVSSQPGHGSTFRVCLPLEKNGMTVLSDPTVTCNDAELRLKAKHGGARILLTEDEPINREVAHGLLLDAGLVVDLAEDGAAAVELALKYRYDLILMDMQMPRMNGVEATRVIRAESMNRETPVVAMTANVFENDRQACLDAGMNDHLGKPVRPDDLYATIMRWID